MDEKATEGGLRRALCSEVFSQKLESVDEVELRELDPNRYGRFAAQASTVAWRLATSNQKLA